MVDMANYLDVKVADYTTVELSVTPDNVMTEEGKKNQIIHEFDDGTVNVVTLSDSYFTVTLQWGLISSSDKDSILDMFHSETKANGMARTFYWQHPIDGHTYVVRFMSELNISVEEEKVNVYTISTTKLRVEGKKAT